MTDVITLARQLADEFRPRPRSTTARGSSRRENYDRMRETRYLRRARARGVRRARRRPADDGARAAGARPRLRIDGARREHAPVPGRHDRGRLPRRQPGASSRLLRRIADEGIVIASNGAEAIVVGRVDDVDHGGAQERRLRRSTAASSSARRRPAPTSSACSRVTPRPTNADRSARRIHARREDRRDVGHDGHARHREPRPRARERRAAGDGDRRAASRRASRCGRRVRATSRAGSSRSCRASTSASPKKRARRRTRRSAPASTARTATTC